MHAILADLETKGRPSFQKSVRTAVKSLVVEGEIRKIEKTLGNYRSQVELYLGVRIQ